MTVPAPPTPEQLHADFHRLPRHRRLFVGYSGGLDSTVLLHLCRAADLRPTAIHVNHQLQPAAAGWVQHCRDVCVGWGLPFVAVEVRVEPGAAGLEAAARAARYGALRDCLQPDDVLAVAHHLDDQAETVLLRLLRGTGIAGLAAMQPLTVFAPGMLWRPLLDTPREALRAYARTHSLRWVEDPQNADPRFSRSWLRREVLQRARQRWPQLSESLGRTARLAAEADALLQELAEADLARLTLQQGLSIPEALRLSAARRNNALRGWLRRQGHPAPPLEVLARLEQEVLRAAADAQPVLVHGELEFRRFRQALIVLPRLPAPPGDAELDWAEPQLALPPGCGRLVATRAPDPPLRVRFPCGGERLKPAGSRHTRTLKQLFQAGGVPAWARERTPLLYRDGELVAVGDRWISHRFQRAAAAQGFRWRWESELNPQAS